MTDLDRIRAVLDQLATDTAPGENDYMGTYDAYEAAIDAISRIAYPEEERGIRDRPGPAPTTT